MEWAQGVFSEADGLLLRNRIYCIEYGYQSTLTRYFSVRPFPVLHHCHCTRSTGTSPILSTQRHDVQHVTGQQLTVGRNNLSLVLLPRYGAQTGYPVTLQVKVASWPVFRTWCDGSRVTCNGAGNMTEQN
ncbi:hypothetical protein CEXT_389921 [Caerostris extrusa]|uniref:Uncharacterized protein n=1 Tax=Caerostris extrusa TaxID=172846 RepID=A0AAV4M609_CAEEX|nr:hypothetical protein CEXT_389921 [Caerostris extrusa]